MEEYQQRVIEESNQLLFKMMKLTEFLESTKIRIVSEAEQDRLKRQLFAMQKYSAILIERIEAFTGVK